MLWWIVLAISVAVYAALAGVLFSRTFFTVAQKHPQDRGLMSFKEKNGNSIVYEPRPEYRKHMPQYILSDRGGLKSILCKLSADVTRIDYDIVLFNASDRAFKVINIKETIERAEYTRTVELPAKTSCASIVVNSVNGRPLNNAKPKNVLNRRTVFFSSLSGILTLIEVFLIKLCLANLFADVFATDFMTSFAGTALTVFIALAATVLNIPAAALYITLKSKRGANEL